MAPTGIRQAEVKQPVLKHLPTDRDGSTLEQGEIGDPEYARAVLLQEVSDEKCPSVRGW